MLSINVNEIFSRGSNIGSEIKVDKEENQSALPEEKDVLSLSAEGLTKANEKAMLDMYRQQVEGSNEAAEAMEDVAKLMEIARRIANGDKVPSGDEKKLMEYNFKLYQVAKSAAMMAKNNDPKNYKSLFEDEKNSDIKEQIRGLEEGGDQVSSEELTE